MRMKYLGNEANFVGTVFGQLVRPTGPQDDHKLSLFNRQVYIVQRFNFMLARLVNFGYEIYFMLPIITKYIFAVK